MTVTDEEAEESFLVHLHPANERLIADLRYWVELKQRITKTLGARGEGPDARERMERFG